MIVFHEGLPRSGKSYEACVYHILEALKQGRDVITNIEGINNAKFSELTGIPEKFVAQMINCVYHEDVLDDELRLEAQKKSFVNETKQDSLVVIDEVQDLWPSSNRQKMHMVEQKYFTEHGHKGLDILVMGQDRRDVHNIIRRRIKRVIVFVQQTAVGRNNHYIWTAFEATKPECYQKIRSGPRKYEKKYFGLYKSHSDSTKNKGVYNDDRANILKSWYVVFVAPAFLVFICFAVYNLFNFFNSTNDDEIVEDVAKVDIESAQAKSEKALAYKVARAQVTSKPVPASQLEPESEPKEPEYLDSFDRDINKYKPRLAGVVYTDEKLIVSVEILDSGLHRKDVYDGKAIKELGWDLEYSHAGLVITKLDQRHLIRSWPVDPWGTVATQVRERL